MTVIFTVLDSDISRSDLLPESFPVLTIKTNSTKYMMKNTECKNVCFYSVSFFFALIISRQLLHMFNVHIITLKTICKKAWNNVKVHLSSMFKLCFTGPVTLKNLITAKIIMIKVLVYG